MGLKAPEQTQSNRTAQEALDVGNYPARVVRVIDLGLQPTIDFNTKEPGKPVHKINVTYELVDAFMKDEDGNELEDKPRWQAEDFPLKPMTLDLATSTKRMKAIDPQNTVDGDWSQVLGFPVNVSIGQNPSKKDKTKIYNKILGASPVRPRDADRMPDLKNDPKFFSLDEPDLEVFNTFPQFLQEIIKGNLEYDGSKLQALLEGKPQKAEKPKKAVEEFEKAGPDVGDGEDAPW